MSNTFDREKIAWILGESTCRPVRQDEVELVLSMVDELSVKLNRLAFILKEANELSITWQESPDQQLKLAGKSLEDVLDQVTEI